MDVIRWRLQNNSVIATAKLFPGNLTLEHNDIVTTSFAESPVEKWRVLSIVHEATPHDGLATTVTLAAWQGQWAWVRNDEQGNSVISIPSLESQPPTIPVNVITPPDTVHPYGLEFTEWAARSQAVSDRRLAISWDVGADFSGEFQANLQRMDYSRNHAQFVTREPVGDIFSSSQRSVNNAYVSDRIADLFNRRTLEFTKLPRGIVPDLFTPAESSVRETYNLVLADSQGIWNAFTAAPLYPAVAGATTPNLEDPLYSSITRSVASVQDSVLNQTIRPFAIMSNCTYTLPNFDPVAIDYSELLLKYQRNASEISQLTSAALQAGVGGSVKAGDRRQRWVQAGHPILSVVSTLAFSAFQRQFMTDRIDTFDRTVVTTYGTRELAQPAFGRSTLVDIIPANISTTDADFILNWDSNSKPEDWVTRFVFMLYEGHDWTGIPIAEGALRYSPQFDRNNQYKAANLAATKAAEGYTLSASDMVPISGNQEVSTISLEAGKVYSLTMRTDVTDHEDANDTVYTRTIWRTFSTPTVTHPNPHGLNVVPAYAAADALKPPKTQVTLTGAIVQMRLNASETVRLTIHNGTTQPAATDNGLGNASITNSNMPTGNATDEGWANFPLSAMNLTLTAGNSYTIRIVEQGVANPRTSYFTTVLH